MGAIVGLPVEGGVYDDQPEVVAMESAVVLESPLGYPLGLSSEDAPLVTKLATGGPGKIYGASGLV